MRPIRSVCYLLHWSIRSVCYLSHWSIRSVSYFHTDRFNQCIILHRNYISSFQLIAVICRTDRFDQSPFYFYTDRIDLCLNFYIHTYRFDQWFDQCNFNFYNSHLSIRVCYCRTDRFDQCLICGIDRFDQCVICRSIRSVSYFYTDQFDQFVILILFFALIDSISVPLLALIAKNPQGPNPITIHSITLIEALSPITIHSITNPPIHSILQTPLH